MNYSSLCPQLLGRDSANGLGCYLKDWPNKNALQKTMKTPQFRTTVERAFDKNGRGAFLIKLSTPLTEVNIYATASDIEKLDGLIHRQTDYVLAGISAASAVHWQRLNEDVYVLIGEDSEVWDICIVIDSDVVERIASEANDLINRKDKN
ncbi:hypothetical protein [Achromobacter sp. NCFB-sbj8-Ac1-l]|uniref:hypothetical protein n=1 Tax=unclassified Achromobacter TaxID=2626865 RepID=UPI004046B924